MATILITGGTGMVGTALTNALIEKGHEVIILTRKAKPPKGKVQYKEWNVKKGTIDVLAITDADYIVHLAGANVAGKRWTPQRKKEIVNSRVQSSELLVKTLYNHPNSVKAVISASAQGWYGQDPQIPNPHPFVESDPASNDFLGRTCQQWEGAIAPVANLGKRLAIFRLGIVLSRTGGAYTEFRKPVAFGATAILGNGKQRVSWIHIKDLVRLLIAAIENEQWVGIFNAVAPQPVSNKELVLQIAKERRRFYIPVYVPTVALKIALGEMSTEVLKSTTVSSRKTETNGFEFHYPSIQKAVASLEREK